MEWHGRRLRESARDILLDVREWFAEEWRTFLFVVCLLMVLGQYGPLRPISQLSAIMLSYWEAGKVGDDLRAGSPPRASGDRNVNLWLVGIDPADAETRLTEARPPSP